MATGIGLSSGAERQPVSRRGSRPRTSRRQAIENRHRRIVRGLAAAKESALESIGNRRAEREVDCKKAGRRHIGAQSSPGATGRRQAIKIDIDEGQSAGTRSRWGIDAREIGVDPRKPSRRHIGAQSYPGATGRRRAIENRHRSVSRRFGCCKGVDTGRRIQRPKPSDENNQMQHARVAFVSCSMQVIGKTNK